MNKLNYFFSIAYILLALSACKQEKPNKEGNATTTKKPEDITDRSIVYINSDSLIAGYELYKKSSKEIEVEKNKYSSDVEGQANAFQNKVLAAQQKSSAMTMGEIEATKKALAAEEQRITQYRDALMQNLANQEKGMVEKLNKNIDEYVKRYAQKNSHKMILGYKQGVTAWYCDPKLDVTQEILKGLNEEFKNQKEQTETTNKKVDSTKK